MRKLLMLALFGVGLLAVGPAAHAASISGEIHFAGLWTPTGGSGTATATGIDFAEFEIVLGGTGTYTGLSGTGATFHDFTFSPFGASVVPLWSLSSGGVDYSFDLTAVTVAFRSATALVLSGSGVLHATGFADTASDWSFSGTGGNVLFSFASDNVAVPEPTSLGLVGFGLLGLTAAGTKRAQRLA